VRIQHLAPPQLSVRESPGLAEFQAQYASKTVQKGLCIAEPSRFERITARVSKEPRFTIQPNEGRLDLAEERFDAKANVLSIRVAEEPVRNNLEVDSISMIMHCRLSGDSIAARFQSAHKTSFEATPNTLLKIKSSLATS
jgi:hypothetical protein